jgi:hypothetical protein
VTNSKFWKKRALRSNSMVSAFKDAAHRLSYDPYGRAALTQALKYLGIERIFGHHDLVPPGGNLANLSFPTNGLPKNTAK